MEPRRDRNGQIGIECIGYPMQHRQGRNRAARFEPGHSRLRNMRRLGQFPLTPASLDSQLSDRPAERRAILAVQYQCDAVEARVRRRVRVRCTGRSAVKRARTASYMSVAPESSTTERRRAKGIFVGELSRAPLRRAT